MTPADEKYVKVVRAKIAGYPRLAREALRRGEYGKAEVGSRNKLVGRR